MVSRETSEPQQQQESPVDAVAWVYDGLRKAATDFYRSHPGEGGKPAIMGGKTNYAKGESVVAAARRRAERERLDQRYGRKKPVRRIPTDVDGRRKRRRWEPAPLGQLWAKEVEARGWSEYVHQQFVVENWEAVVGTYIAQNTTIKMFKDRTLFLESSSYAKAKELEWLKDKMLTAIEAKVGPNIVNDVKVFPPATRSWRFGKLHVKGRGPRDTYD